MPRPLVKFDVDLLGGFALAVDGRASEPLSPKLRALLAHVVLHRHAPQDRRHLAFLFWPDSTESQARTNLRRSLHQLRGVVPAADQLLDTEGVAVAWRGEGARVDVIDFEDAMSAAEEAERAGDVLAEHHALDEAVRRYGGDLLPGAYDDWLLVERDRLARAFTWAAGRLTELLEGERRHKEAIRVAERLRRHDPLHEPAYRALMRLHAADGDRAAALRSFHGGATALEHGLGVEPDEATRRVYEQLVSGPAPGPTPTPQIAAARTAPLVGRRAELERLREAWSVARAGDRRLVMLGGEAGVGKSRLAEELLTEVRRQGHPWSRARAHAAEGQLVYGPVIDWLRSTALRSGLSSLDDVWLTELVRLVPDLATERPDLAPPDPLIEGWRRNRLFEAMARAASAAAGPTLLVLDDLQWCDRETLEWLHYLLRFDGPEGLLVVGTVRSHDIEAGHPLADLLEHLRSSYLLVELDLSPLSSEQTVQLARGVSGGSLDPELETSIYRQTGGIPFFVVESVHAGVPTRPMPDHSLPPEGGDGLRESLPPPRIRSLIEGRLRALSPGAQELAQLAAVAGGRFTLPVLARASGTREDELVEVIDELWRHRIVREHSGEAYDFAHDLLRAVTYAQVSPVLRRTLHRRVARALDASGAEGAAAVAAHYDRAGSPEPAVEHYLAAAEDAQAVFALSEAERLLRRGLDLIEEMPPATRRRELALALHTALGVCLVAVDGYGSTEVRRELSAAVELSEALGRPAAAPVLRGLALSSVAQADPRRSHEVGRQLLALAEASDDPLLYPEARYVLGVCHFWMGEFEDSRRELEAAVAAYSEGHHREHVALYSQDPGVVCLSRLAYALWYLGEGDRARRTAADALALGERLGHPFSLAYALNYVAWLAHDAGDRAEFERTVGALGEMASEHHIGFFAHMWPVLEGRRTALAGDPTGGVTLIESGLARYHATGQDLHRPYGLLLLALTQLDRGAPIEARAATDEALAMGERTGEHFLDAALHTARVEAILAADPTARSDAARGLATAAEIARRQGARALQDRVAQATRRLLPER